MKKLCLILGILGLSAGVFAQIYITKDETWSRPRQVSDNVIIMPGVTLTVNTTVSCDGNVLFRVQPGCKIVVRDGKMTSSGEKLWYGIVVDGNRTLPQLPIHQGTLELIDATVENAIFAVGASSYEVSTRNSAGGIIYADNTRFINNVTSVLYTSYGGFDFLNRVKDNEGRFSDCSFTFDRNNLFEQNGFEFKNHVRMEGVRGIDFSNCSFENQTGRYGGTGIYAYNAGFRVTEDSYFYNFEYGILASNFGNPFQIIVDQSQFSNNLNGIEINATINSRITRNQITNVLGVGLKSEGSSRFQIEGNIFIGSKAPASKTIYGIIVSYSGTSENLIYRNEFYGFDWGYGISVKGTNADMRSALAPGLQFICNKFEENRIDIRVQDSSTVRPNQGNVSQGADNKFYGTKVSSFYNENSNNPINYFFSPLPEHVPYMPLNVILIGFAVQNPCNSTFGIDFGVPMQQQINNYMSMQLQYDNLVNQFQALGYDCVLENITSGQYSFQVIQDALQMHADIDNLSILMTKTSNNAISFVMGENYLNTEMLNGWNNIINTPITKYALAETHLFTNNYQKAEDVLNEIPVLFNFNATEMEEHNKYVQLYDLKIQLKLSDRNMYELSNNEILLLITIAEENTGRASIMARTILCDFYGICYEDETIEIKSGEMIDFKPNDNKKTEKDNIMSYFISENILTANVDNVEKIEIYDITGRIVCTSSGKNTINVGNLQQGVFIIKIFTEDLQVISSKFVKE